MQIQVKRSIRVAEAVPAVILVLIAAICGCTSKEETEMGKVEVAAIELSSPAFEHNGRISKEYTVDGDNVSPALQWKDVPGGTRSIALICEDPDAPVGTFTHWVIFNMPPGKRGLPRGVPASPRLAEGSLQGRNDFGRIGYSGPAPPTGPAHRYFFRIYALDRKLDLEPGTARKQLVRAMEGRILAEGELIGKFSR